MAGHSVIGDDINDSINMYDMYIYEYMQKCVFVKLFCIFGVSAYYTYILGVLIHMLDDISSLYMKRYHFYDTYTFFRK